jgi:hypothetical protein
MKKPVRLALERVVIRDALAGFLARPQAVSQIGAATAVGSVVKCSV